ncbi:hypothetical protein MKK55_15215 [Methylobacterium sp. J-059]|uniref:hypothetical protein n=1 Tax=Methylobacterium sp. J-059 TaxID=2836643 RepID=UPI001FB939EA|nr:hypothetical protein [Methylobacterium sp. J-059]MCJ2040281.1 hypothetical protein [Methylobacterium sp. J-059]
MDQIRGAASTFGGLQSQTLRGMARGAAGLAGLPVDAATFALNNDSDVQNILGLIGLGGKKIERPLFGSERNKEAVDSAFDAAPRAVNAVAGTNLRLPSEGPQNLPERVLGRVGEEVGAMAVPVGGAISAGARMAPEAIAGLPKIARMFVEPASVNAGKFAQKEIGSAFAAGIGASGVNEVTRAAGVKDDSLGHAAGDLAGAFGGLGALGVARHVGPKIADVFNALRGDPGFANQVAKDGAVDMLSEAYGLPSARLGAKEATDTQPLIDAITRGKRIGDTIPGYQESLADRTASDGLAGLEYARQAAGGGAFATRNKTNIKAVDDAIQANAPNGSPGAFRGVLEDRRTGLLQGAATDATAAQSRFEDAASRLQSAMHADARGADIRAPLEDAMAAAREVERGAWSGVSEGSADIRPLVDRFADVRSGLSQAEQAVFEPSHLTGIPRRFLPAEAEAAEAAVPHGPSPSALDGMDPQERAMAERLFSPPSAATAPAPAMSLEDRIMAAAEGLPRKPNGQGRDIWDIRAALPDMSEADLRTGLLNLQRQNRGVLSQYSDPKTLAGRKGIEVASGDARHIFIPGDEANHPSLRSAGFELRPEPAPAPPAAPPPAAPPAAPAAPEPVAVPLSEATGLRSALTDAQRSAASTGDLNRARVIGRYVDAVDAYFAEHHPNQGAYDQARAVSLDLNDRFTRPQTAIAQTLDRQQGLPRVPDSGVPGRFVQPDSGRVSDFDALMREAGNDPRARGAVRDQILSQVERLRTPDQIEAFTREHSRVLSQFPDLRQEIEGAAGLRRSADAATARQAELRGSLGDASTPGTSSVGRYLRYGDEASTSAMKGVMNAPKPAEAMDELLNFAGNRPEAVEGAKRTFWDIMEGRARSSGETTASIDGVQPWKGAALRKFLAEPRNRAVAERLYRDNPQHLRNVEQIADVMQRGNTAVRARAPGSSGTSQGMSQVLSPETLQSRLYAYKRGQVSGTFLITSIAAVAGRRSVAAAQKGAIGRLVDEALVNPDAAALLLKENNPANRAKLARSAKGWIGSEAGTVVDALNDEDEDPVMRAVRGGRR